MQSPAERLLAKLFPRWYMRLAHRFGTARLEQIEAAIADLRRTTEAVNRSLREIASTLAREATTSARVDQLEPRVSDVARLASQLRYGAAPSAMGPDLSRFELSVNSQNGEDGVLLHLLERLGVGTRNSVELGCGDGRECITAHLLLDRGWSGTLVDADPANVAAARRFYELRLGADTDRVSIRQDQITTENVNIFLPADGTELLAIDIDGNDYWVWEATEARPAIVVIEYNPSFGCDGAVTIPYDPGFRYSPWGDDGSFSLAGLVYHGASLTALARLGERKGYDLLGCDSAGVNAFFVRSDLARSAGLSPLSVRAAWRPSRLRERLAPQEAQESAALGQPLVLV